MSRYYMTTQSLPNSHLSSLVRLLTCYGRGELRSRRVGGRRTRRSLAVLVTLDGKKSRKRGRRSRLRQRRRAGHPGAGPGYGGGGGRRTALDCEQLPRAIAKILAAHPRDLRQARRAADPR